VVVKEQDLLAAFEGEAVVWLPLSAPATNAGVRCTVQTTMTLQSGEQVLNTGALAGDANGLM
jgi:hypothetical protein